MKVSDYVIEFLVEQKITEIFTVSGGGSRICSIPSVKIPR